MEAQPSSEAALRRRRFLPTALGGVAVLYGVWYAIGLLLMATTLLPRTWQTAAAGWGDTSFLSIATLFSALISARDHPRRPLAWACLLILLGAGGIEVVGVLHGLPFGNYIYTDLLGHRLAGVLPWGIPLCWLLLILSAHALCGALLTRAPDVEISESALLLNVATATVITLVDLILEPVAAHVRHYWIWLDRDPLWYGVPPLNFVGWFATAFLLSMLLSWFLDSRRYRLSTAWMALGLLGSIQFLFAMLNWRAGFFATAFIALNLTGGLAFLLIAAGGRTPSRRGDAAL